MVGARRLSGWRLRLPTGVVSRSLVTSAEPATIDFGSLHRESRGAGTARRAPSISDRGSSSASMCSMHFTCPSCRSSFQRWVLWWWWCLLLAGVTGPSAV